ncbi:hypothetical protein ABZZ44_11100 [Streptomyces sp. NPDC006460]|uniref:hypothetical protein n=1 Tax=Streptomyces sp. NPDC006460 TaxID=3154304 RepID=UPI0033B7755E
MPDRTSAALVSLLLTGFAIFTPLIGAIVAAVSIRRRGRNARLALAGCLVMVPAPLVTVLGPLVLETLVRHFGPYMAFQVISAIALPFHLVGFALVLAGALTGPSAPPTPGTTAADDGPGAARQAGSATAAG